MWVELMDVQNAYIAETWRELFAAEALKVLVVPLREPWTEAGDLEPRKLYVPHGKLHVAKEILRKI